MFAQYIDSSFGYMSCVCRKNYRHNNYKVVLCLANTLLVYVSNCTERDVFATKHIYSYDRTVIQLMTQLLFSNRM